MVNDELQTYSLTEVFGANVFNDAAMRERLPKPAYKALRRL